MKTFAFTLCTFILSIGSLIAQPLWLRYPAISPDGSTVVFTYKGDLYRVAASGGTATPLTIDATHEFMPVWSHDGSQLAFASDRYGNFDVFVMPSTGGEAKRLTHHSGNDYPSDFSGDNNAVLFSSLRIDLYTNAQFPNRTLAELYSVPAAGGRVTQVLTTPAEDAKINGDGSRIYFHDRKGYEDPWRKHHTSSITRDIWYYDVTGKTYNQLTTWEGEDRNPILNPNDNMVYWLSERGGHFNIYKMNAGESSAQAVTNFTGHPVRFLTMAADGTLCYSWNGELYTQSPSGEPQKINIAIANDTRGNLVKAKRIEGITEMSPSPNGKEFAYIYRGEVFVSSVEDGVTKRITNTPEQERNVSFSPDGRSLVYAGERNNSWNVYVSKIDREEEKYFYASTLISEEAVAATVKEEFQPAFSPDGKEVAYLEERVSLKVVNLDTKAARMVYEAQANYSYSDGDQYYQWSPDSKWFLINFNRDGQWIPEAGLIKASGQEPIINLTNSGYSDNIPKWAMDGEMMVWFSDRDGMKNHGSWGASGDVYGMFFTQEVYDEFTLSKEDFTLLKEVEEEDDKEDESDKEDEDEGEVVVNIELAGIEDRKLRLTQHSALLSDAVLSDDGEKLYYLAEYEDGYDLWMTKPREKETKLLTKVGPQANSLFLDKDNKNVFVQGGGKIFKIDTESGKKTPLKTQGEMMFDPAGERAYIFDHTWRQVQKKFYVEDLHGVDWDFYYAEYAKFLPHIGNNHEFTEMLSELLGELNASHTGCRYRERDPSGDETASLGLFYDENYAGAGLRVAEVMTKGPLDNAESKVAPGVIIEKINGATIGARANYFSHFNRIKDKNTLLHLYNPANGQRWEEVVKPISMGTEYGLLYNRWVDLMRDKVEEMSEGRLGYVHVRGMNNGSYRTVVEEVLGRNYEKEALIVDTRFNGGGWLHEDLATFLSGEKYIQFAPREKRLGYEPQFKWSKPTVVLVGESNYSDAHMFPFAYRSKKIGQIIGMPVPGTGTAVWWERQIDPTLVFGIPQVGMLSMDGEYLENNQLEPDIKLPNAPEQIILGVDQQLTKAVEVLLEEQDQYKVDLEKN